MQDSKPFLEVMLNPEQCAAGLLPMAPAYGPRLQNVDLYKAAHHGARANDNADFINLLRPRDVGIGVGATNGYGHPTSEALGLYQAVGAEVWRTDKDGTFLITVKSNGTYTIESETRRMVSRVAKGASMVIPAVPRPNLVGTLNVLGRVLYVYDAALPEPRSGAVNPALLSTVTLNGATLYIYEGQAP